MNSEVKSAVRTLEVLELLGAAVEPVTLKDIAVTLGYPKSSAHALTQTLVGRGYVLQEGERYVICDTIRPGFTGQSRHAALVRLAQPVMDELRRRVGETVLLGVLTPRGDVRTLAKSVSDNPVRFDKDLERTSVAHCTAMGRVLLAFSDDKARETHLARTPLAACTPRTVTDQKRLHAILRQVRAGGIAFSEDEHVLGSTGIAAPVFDRNARIVAALDIGAITARFRAGKDQMIVALREAAANLSRRIGQI